MPSASAASINTINPVDRHVGSRVRMRRLMLGNSQSDLADALGITFQQVQKYEKGSNRISASKLQQAANFLKIPVSFFFEGAPTVPNNLRYGTKAYLPTEITDLMTRKEGLALVAAFVKIRDQGLRHLIVQLVEQIAKQFKQ